MGRQHEKKHKLRRQKEMPQRPTNPTRTLTSVEANAQQLPQSLWSRTRPMTEAQSGKASRPSKLTGMPSPRGSVVAARFRSAETVGPPALAPVKLGIAFAYFLEYGATKRGIG